MSRLVDAQNVKFHRIDFNRGGFVVFAIEFEFFPTAKPLPLIPPKRIRDVDQISAIVIDTTASFKFPVGVIAETWGKMKRNERDEEEEAGL